MIVSLSDNDFQRVYEYYLDKLQELEKLGLIKNFKIVPDFEKMSLEISYDIISEPMEYIQFNFIATKANVDFSEVVSETNPS